MIRRDQRGPVSVLRIDRHAQRNALDIEHCVDLRAALDDAVAGGDRAVVITGEGSSFCAGADLSGVYGPEFRDALYGLLGTLTRMPVPVLAAVNGPAIGAGAQLAIACDLRIAAETATFAVPTARLGLAVDPWTVRRLGLLAGGGTARRLLLAAEAITADEAHRCGLVDHLGTLADTLERADQIAALAPLSIGYSKAALYRLFEADVADPVLREGFDAVWASDDLKEGRQARQEGRPPRFQGR